MTEVAKLNCLAEEVLGWGPQKCPGPEFAASALLGREACRTCILPCVDALVFKREQAEKAEQAALIDTVTGLANRQVFDDTFSRMVRRAQPFGLVVMDLDGLKRVNDGLGHSQGDYALKLLADTGTKMLRPMDRLFRIGGDEFAALLDEPNIPDAFDQRIEGAYTKAVKGAGFAPALELGVSVGYGVYSGGDGGRFFDLVDNNMMIRKLERRPSRNPDFTDPRELPPQSPPTE